MSLKQIIALSILGFVFISSGILFSQTDLSETLAAAITSTTDPSSACVEELNQIHGTTLTNDLLNITSVRLNDDKRTDYLVEKKSPEFCGSTGCIFELCVVTAGEATIIPFGLAAEKLTIKETLTNGMHDLQLQGQSTTNLTWDTERYTVTQ